MTTSVDFGTDLALQDDVSPEFPEVTGLQVLIDACVRRLSTPQGDLWYDPSYGYDLTELLSDALSPGDLANIEHEIIRQLELEDMVEAAECTISDVTDELMTVDILVQTAQGPFPLVLAVTDVTVQVLQAHG